MIKPIYVFLLTSSIIIHTRDGRHQNFHAKDRCIYEYVIRYELFLE
jgi:hypothetical protein